MLRRLFTPRARLLNKTPVPTPGLHRRPISVRNTVERIKDPGPPILARYPSLYNIFQGLKYGLGLLLASHVFVDYFYAMHMTWGPSMLPTLNATGDSVIISKYYRHGRGVQVGDLVSFKHPLKEEVRVIKRIIGMPGDFVLRDTPGQGDGIMIQVPSGHCWVVGDNLPHSRDSRMYGPLPLGLVRGKVVGVWRGWLQWPELLPNALQDVEDDF